MTTSDSRHIEPMTAKTPAEKLLLKRVKTGGEAQVSTGLDPKDPAVWRDEHAIRAIFLRHICLHPGSYEVDPRGIYILGALITGKLDLSACSVSRPFWFVRCRFDTPPDLTDATTRTVTLNNCWLPGLQADRLVVQGGLFLRNSTIEGETRLMGADIQGQLGCEGAVFTNTNKGGKAFSADELRAGGNVVLVGVTATGETRLLGTDIKGSLDCTGATFTNEGGYAFNADRLKVSGNVFLLGVMVAGETSLLGANIQGQLNCREATFKNEGGKALNAQAMHVMEGVLWYPKERPVGLVDFSFAQVGIFEDDLSGWSPHTLLDGFEYKRFGAPTTADARIGWLKQMPQEWNDAPIFLPQPYEQLIKVFRETGHEHEARKVAIAKQDVYAAHLKRVQEHGTRNTLLRRAVMWLFKITAGYGYKPWRALLLAIVVTVVMGSSVFGGAAYSGHMRPAKERIYMSACFTGANTEDCKAWVTGSLIGESRYKMTLPPDYPAFSALSYSLDVFVPIVDLHQESYWLPNEGQYRIYMWLHIVAGWVLTTIAVTGFAGVLKKD
ncbi:MAG: hypothetical protein NUV50_01670 [Rhodospirillales bacterium]|nr:hypothetical protein [Rhodospirillales bacterium]